MKPSEFPEHTVIDDPKHGKFIKENNGIWVQINPACRELQDIIWDTGRVNHKNRPANFIPEKSDDYFKDFEIISVPQGWYPPYIEHEVVYWYDLSQQQAIRKTTIHEIIDDYDGMAEEEIEFAKPRPILWRDIPEVPTYETCMGWNGAIHVRNKKTRQYKVRARNGFFTLYVNGKRDYWCEGELGTTTQIRHFYKTGEVGADV